jgi:hypothetical protein
VNLNQRETPAVEDGEDYLWWRSAIPEDPPSMPIESSLLTLPITEVPEPCGALVEASAEVDEASAPADRVSASAVIVALYVQRAVTRWIDAARGRRAGVHRVGVGLLAFAFVVSTALGIKAAVHGHSLTHQTTTATEQYRAAMQELNAVTAKWHQAETNFKTATTNYATAEQQLTTLTNRLNSASTQPSHSGS